mgnify:CR=1 FL=1
MSGSEQRAPRARNLETFLRRIRESSGLTLLALAEKCGLSTSTIRRIESGRRLPTRSQKGRLFALPRIGSVLACTALRALASQEWVEAMLANDDAPSKGGEE